MTKHSHGSNNALVAGPGQTLKQGREGRGLSVDDVADELHLRPSVVRAIEEENYESLPGVIFLKGYIRSYSSLLGLNEDEMVKLLDQQFNHEATQQASRDDAQGKAKRKKASKHVATVMTVAVLVGIGLYFWSQQLGDNQTIEIIDSGTTSAVIDNEGVSKELPVEGESTVDALGDRPERRETSSLPTLQNQSSEGSEENAVDNQPSEGVVSSNEESLGGEAVDQESTIGPSEVESDFKESLIETGSVNKPEGIAPPATSVEVKSPEQPKTDVDESSPSVAASATNESMEVTEPLVNETVEPPVNVVDETSTSAQVLETGKVKITFSGDCWFTLSNGEGKTVIAALKKAGDEVNYSGPLPFNLLVGAVSETVIIFDDHPVDLNKVKVWNNRAELELTH